MTAEQREQEAKAFAKRMMEEALRLRDKERELLMLRSELSHAEKPVVEKKIEQIKAEIEKRQ